MPRSSSTRPGGSPGSPRGRGHGHREDRLIGLVRFGRAAAAAEDRTLLEACAEGWWYAAVLPDAQAVTAFFTDADLLPVGAVERDTATAHTGILSECTGGDWLAVGDAARTLDPLSGQGLITALTSAIRASEAVLAERRTAALDGVLAAPGDPLTR